VIVLGNLRRSEGGTGMRLGRQDLQLLSPLASGLAVTLGNATQVAQIKEEKSTLEQILGLSSDGILLLDGKGRVRVWNQAMERITGVAGDDAVGLPYDELLAGLDHDGKLVRLETCWPRPPRPAPGPRPRSRSAPPRGWSGGCAATTRCCTRAGSGPPTW
jgi:PAS domain-containing protein